MLLTDFYQILKTEETGNGCTFIISLNAEHPVYKGHFPQVPVLPGVCTLQIIKECAHSLLNIPVRYHKISSCKFLSSVNPLLNNNLILSIALQEKEDGFSLSAVGVNDDITFIKVKASLTGLE